MMELNIPSRLRKDFEQPKSADGDVLGFSTVFDIVRRRIWIIVLCVGVALAVASVYLAGAVPTYVATAELIIDPKRPEAGGSDRGGTLQYSIDNSQIQTQIRLIESERIARDVIEGLNLKSDPELTLPAPSPFAWLRSAVFASRTATNDTTEPEPVASRMGADPSASTRTEARPTAESTAADISFETRIQEAFSSRLSARRVGDSYALEISFASRDPAKAAKICNSVVAAYIRDQLDVRLSSAQNGSEVLAVRITNLESWRNIASKAISTGEISIDDFPSADARVISGAVPPLGKSAPQASIVLAFAGVLGLFVGALLAGLRHLTDRRVMSGAQVERALDVPVIGTLARFPKASKPFNYLSIITSNEFKNGMRSIKAMMELNRRDSESRCIGVVSPGKGEGKSLVAVSIAHEFSRTGSRTLLIDANPASRSLTKFFAGDPKLGLSDILRTENWDSPAIVRYGDGLHFIPLTRDFPVDFSSLKTVINLRSLLLGARSRYDLIVFDLPAFDSGVETREIAPLLEGFVIVAEQGSTTIDSLEEGIHLLKAAQKTLIGVILNKVPLAKT